RDDLESLALDAGDDVADDVAAHAVGLDQDKGALHGSSLLDGSFTVHGATGRARRFRAAFRPGGGYPTGSAVASRAFRAAAAGSGPARVLRRAAHRLDPPPQDHPGDPQADEDDAQVGEARYHQAAGQEGRLQHARGVEAPGEALQRGQDQRGQGETAPDRSGQGWRVAAELDGDGDGQSQHHRLEGQDNGADGPHGHSFFIRWVASPAVTTEPVTSTPAPPNAASRSARVTAASMASSRRAARWTRSSPKTSSATRW